MAQLASVADFRAWSGANTPASVSDVLVANCLDEAEAAICQETGQTVPTILSNPAAFAIAHSDILRRASRYLARRNSPESIAGAGSEGLITVPSRDPDSQAATRQIRSILLTWEAIA